MCSVSFCSTMRWSEKISGLVRSIASSALSSRRFEPSSSGCSSLIGQFEAREIARVVMEQAVRSAGRRADIAVAVHDDEGVAGFERAPRARRRIRDRDVERSLRNRVDMECLHGGFGGHGRLPFRVVECRLVPSNTWMASAERLKNLGHRLDGASARRNPRAWNSPSPGPRGRRKCTAGYSGIALAC